MSNQRKLARKLFLLFGLLFAGLTALATVPVKDAEARICCSACDADPIPPPCFSGCSPSC
jgi:hypothetical protein